MRHGMATFGQEGTGSVDRELLRRILPFALQQKRPLAVSIALLPLVACLQLVQPYILKQAIDGPIASGRPEGLGPLALLLLGSLLVQYSLQFLQTYCSQLAGQGIVHELRVAVHGHLLDLHDRFFTKNPAGKLLTRCTNDVEGIGEMFASGLLTLVADVVLLFGICISLLLLNWRLALVSFVVLPFLLAISGYFQRALRGAYREIRAKVSSLNTYLQERVSGIAVVQLFARERQALDEFQEHSYELMRVNIRSIRLDATLFAVVDMMSHLVTALLVWYAAGPIVHDVLTLGALVAFIDYVRRFFQPIRDLAQKFATLQAGLASAERVFSLLDEDDQVPIAARPRVPEDVGGTVEFRGVRFGYKPGEPVLRGLDLQLAAGERVALVGVTGAGKTTSIRLVNRVYDAEEGLVLVDGLDVRQWPLDVLRRAVGVVPQEVFLFMGTVRENLSLHDPSVPDERLWSALDEVGARAMVERLGGLDARIGERGGNLSAGEGQLLAFARVLIYDPRILVLDEATSNIDTFSEERIQEAITRTMHGRTCIVVAHRLSTIQQVDRIAVLHQGQLAEIGSHRELMKKDGLYRKLYESYYAGGEAA